MRALRRALPMVIREVAIVPWTTSPALSTTSACANNEDGSETKCNVQNLWNALIDYNFNHSIYVTVITKQNELAVCCNSS